jgi:hypothetical protein
MADETGNNGSEGRDPRLNDPRFNISPEVLAAAKVRHGEATPVGRPSQSQADFEIVVGEMLRMNGIDTGPHPIINFPEPPKPWYVRLGRWARDLWPF